MDESHPEQPAQRWVNVLRAGVEAQELVPHAVASGGTAAALYAHHRLSMDVDHLVSDLSERFEEIRETLERTPHWTTARVHTPKMILGALHEVPVGFRQMLRSLPIGTATVQTPSGPLVVPTLDEMIGMKAYLAYSRRATRDFLDFAALASCLDGPAVLASLLRSDERYGELQTDSVGLEIAKALAEPDPYDLESVDLREYKGVKPPWNQWSRVEETCRSFGTLLAEALLRGESHA